MFANPILSPIIIIGMHRSGTTFLANALNDAGICMGVFRDHNGEALHFLSLNQQILEAAGGNWLEPVKISSTDINTMSAHELYAEHIKCRYHQGWRLRLFDSHHWGWKDPRNTFTLDYWLTLFPAARVIHLYRNGCDVALSLYRRNQVSGEVKDPRLDDLQFCFNLWEKYTAEGHNQVKKLGSRALELSYESLVSLNPDVLNRLSHFVRKDVKLSVKKSEVGSQMYPEQLLAAARTSSLFKSLGYTC